MEEVSVLLLLATTAGVRLIFLLSLAFFAFSLAERPFFCLQFDRRFLRLRNDQSQLSGKEKKSEKRERRGEKASGTPPTAWAEHTLLLVGPVRDARLKSVGKEGALRRGPY